MFEAHPVKPYIMMFAQLQYKINFVQASRQARDVIDAPYYPFGT